MAYEIVAIRTTTAEDLSHEHVELVGYASAHIVDEPIMIPIARVVQRIAFGESFFVTVDGAEAEISGSTCPVCGLEPYLKTSTDSGPEQKLLELPVK